MKVSKSILFAFIFALGSVAAVEEAAQPAPDNGDPCTDPIDEEPPAECLDVGLVCNDKEESCCDGLKCTGFGFFKKCEEPPVCLPQWHDCADGTPCCDDMACTVGKHGQLECQKREIGKRTVTIDIEGNLVATEPPTPAPAPKNLEVTKIPGEPVVLKTACSTGDPHITTFDGLKYDCQGSGEHILLKSLITQREVQARYEHMSTNKAISIGKGVAVQDEGDTPRVQISVATGKGALGNDMSDGCTLQFYVDGVQRDLMEGSGDDRVSVTATNGNNFVIKYTESEFEVTAKYFRCRLNICAKVPKTDETVGVLGTWTDSVDDEWKTLTGEIIPLPESRVNKLKKPGYDFCTQHFCIRDEEKSLFVHDEPGFDFDYYQQCDLPYGETLQRALVNTPVWVRELCGSDAACIMDVMNGDAEDARELRNAKLMTERFCRPSGGVCDNDDGCCGGNKCTDFGGLIGKVCGGDMTCAPEFASCDKLGCCDELTCTQLNDGSHQCMDNRVCQDEWMSCEDGQECCDGTVCLANHVRGTKECRKLPSCMKVKDDCSQVGCCGSLKCVDLANGGKQCQDIPGCWKDQNKDCSVAPCCDGLTCVTVNQDQQLCKRLPSCMRLGQSCEWAPCCENEENPVECVAVTDALGNTGKQCRYEPGEAEVKVWNDINGDGVQDENEPGIAGVGLQLYDDQDKKLIGEVIKTDVEGIVSFKGVPKVRRLRVKVVEAPPGATRTQHRKGGDGTKDSNLRHDNFSDDFRVSGKKWTDTALGYLMPQEVEVKVFNDLNGNGIQEAGEMGIPDVVLRLESKVRNENKEWVYVGISDQGNGGNSHTELTTDVSGIAVFNGVPQNIRMNVAVMDAPDGAIPTRANQGNDDTIDSDLNSNGKSMEFTIRGGSGASNLALGYKMPESVTVRVWDDTNSNGKEDVGELGIAGVQLRLVNDDKEKTPFEQEVEGGTANKVVSTNAAGMATFTKVPQNKRLRVLVVTPPEGAIPTRANAGGVDKEDNSDLQGGNLSDSFTLTTSGAAFSEIDLGYRMPNTMIVRAWDDANGDGVQDDGEKGLAGVEMELVDANGDRAPLPPQNNGGTAGTKVVTNAEGYAAFTMVPQNQYLRVHVTNAPEGARATQKDKGGDKTTDSDLSLDNYSDHFRLDTAVDYTEIDLGYTMPSGMKIRVWDDLNNNGLQDEGESGVEGVGLKLIYDKEKKEVEGFPEIFTDDSGIAQFEGVPSGENLRVKVTNMPKGAFRARQNAERNKMEDLDSDLGSGDMSHYFNLARFEGSTFTSLDFGLMMPKGMEVRVWDDTNANGVQDEGESGIENVQLILIDDKTKTQVVDQQNGGNAHEMLVTDKEGFVKFRQVPKGVNYRVKMLNKPDGAVVTRKNTGGNKNGADETDSDLDSRNLWSDAFNLVSFHGDGASGRVDLGLRLPADTVVRVWEDINGNGLQDEGEPGIKGVRLSIVNDDKQRTAIPNAGDGSTAHLEQVTNDEGIATFVKVPRSKNYRVKVINAPPGSRWTTKNAERNKMEDADSDLNSDWTSDRFNLHYFQDDGNYGKIDLGFKMPKTVVVRAWNDANKDGLQGEDEEPLAGVTMRLVTDKRDENKQYIPMPDQENGGTAHETITTGADGRAVFTKVPQYVRFRVVVVPAPDGFKPTTKNANKNKSDDIDSDMNGNGFTDSFQLPNDCVEFFETIDIGYYAI